MFSIIRTGVLLAGCQKSFSYKSGIGVAKISAVSGLANTVLRMHHDHAKKESPVIKCPMTREEYAQKNLPSFDEFCQKIALPVIENSEISLQRKEELRAPSNLQGAYKGYCEGRYRAYVDSFDPMNPFIL